MLLWDKAKDFIQRAFTVILLASVVVWFFQSFNHHLNYVPSNESMLAEIAGVVSPIFKPMGLGSWQIVTALVAGFMAKESVVSTLTVLSSSEALLLAFTPLSILSLLVFCLLYSPCIAAISSVRRELGRKWALVMVVFQCVLAWLMALLVYAIGSLFV